MAIIGNIPYFQTNPYPAWLLAINTKGAPRWAAPMSSKTCCQDLAKLAGLQQAIPQIYPWKNKRNWVFNGYLMGF